MILWVSTADVPNLDGDPTALSEGEGYLDDIGEDVKEASETATTAWKKINDDIYPPRRHPASDRWSPRSPG